MSRLPVPTTTPRHPGRLGCCAAALLAVLLASADAVAAQLTVRWADTSGNETGFKIERATASSGPFVQVATTPANTTSYVDDALEYATTYFYRVRATNYSGDSGYSNIDSAVTPPPPNTPPSVSVIADQTILEDGALPSVPFTVADAETGAAALAVQVASSDPVLIPTANLVLGGTGATRTLSIRPAANRSGSSEITVHVSDGVFTTSSAFTVLVQPVNDAPSIGAIAHRTVQAGTSSGTIAFTVADVETSAGSLGVSATSSNASLLPSSALLLGGTGSSRTLTFAPPPTTGGTVAVTVRVSDGAATSSTSFTVTISPANTPPTITSIAPQTVLLNAASSALPFTVGDAETSAANLLVSVTSSNTTLVPLTGLMLAGAGAERTLAVRPATNQSGTATITVRVSDGSLASATSFIVTVPQNTAPTLTPLADLTVPTAVPSGLIPFTVGDKETAATSLVVTATSSNAALLPDSALQLGGTGATRSLAFTPPSTLTGGTAVVTVRVSDGLLTTATSFVVTVDATNTAPTLTAIANQDIAMNTAAGPLAFRIGDTQTPAESLTLIANASNQALVPLQNITFAGTGADRTVTVRPAFNTTGWSTIWIQVRDGMLKTTISFVVNVSAPMSFVDVGAPALAGSETQSDGVISITAGGTDIWGTQDQFRFGHVALEGDSEMTVRVASLAETGSTAKAGPMYRVSTDANSAYVHACFTATGRVALHYRSAPGATSQLQYSTAAAVPGWLKLTRSGDTFYAFHSPDGATWSLLDFVTVTMPGSVPAGLAVTARSETLTTTAAFESFRID